MLTCPQWIIVALLVGAVALLMWGTMVIVRADRLRHPRAPLMITDADDSWGGDVDWPESNDEFLDDEAIRETARIDPDVSSGPSGSPPHA